MVTSMSCPIKSGSHVFVPQTPRHNSLKKLTHFRWRIYLNKNKSTCHGSSCLNLPIALWSSLVPNICAKTPIGFQKTGGLWSRPMMATTCENRFYLLKNHSTQRGGFFPLNPFLQYRPANQISAKQPFYLSDQNRSGRFHGRWRNSTL